MPGEIAMRIALALVGASILAVSAAAQGAAAVSRARPPATVYVGNFSSETVTPIQIATGRALRAVQVRECPDGLAVTPDSRTVFAIGDGPRCVGGRVVPISAATSKPGRPIRIGQVVGFPGLYAMTPNGRTLYVLTLENGIAPISVARRTVGRSIKVADATCLAMAPNGRTLYVCQSTNTTVLPGILPISTATGRKGRQIRIPGGTDGGLLITPNGRTGYTWSEEDGPNGNFVTPITLATGKRGRPVLIGNDITGRVLSPDGKRLYFSSETAGVTQISTATDKVVWRIPKQRLPLPGPITVSPDSKTLWVVSEGRLYPVSAATGAVGAPIRVGPGIDCFAFAPGGRTMYAASEIRNDVIPVNTVTGKAGRPIKVGKVPTVLSVTR